jgi:hypothetical protein
LPFGNALCQTPAWRACAKDCSENPAGFAWANPRNCSGKPGFCGLPQKMRHYDRKNTGISREYFIYKKASL